jgi:hypothetical protein
MKKRARRYGLWDMLRDVLVAAIDRGQFPVAVIAIALIVSIMWIPHDEWATIVKDTLQSLREGALLGYLLSVAIATGWWCHVHLIRKRHSEKIMKIESEVDRFKSRCL